MKIKGMFFAALIALFALGANAQDDRQRSKDIKESEVPQAVVETFNQEFASAKDVEWEQKGDMYKAEFDLGDEEKEARFDQAGKLKMTKTEIEKEALPEKVRATLDKDYAGYKIDDVYKVEAKNKTFYKVETKKDGKKEKFVFDDSGKKIEKEKFHDKVK